MSVKRSITIGMPLVLLIATMIFSIGCGVVGADIRLEGLNRGTINMEGKELNGLPSDKINLSLDVAAQTIKVHTTGNGTVLTLVPSGATITISGDSVTLKGLKPDQVKVEWAVKQPSPR